MDQEEMDTDQFDSEIDELIQINLNFKPPVKDESSVWFIEAELAALLGPSDNMSRLEKILKTLAGFLKKHSREIANAEPKVIQECCDRIQRVLLCVPNYQLPLLVDSAYFGLLDALAEVKFPVTSIVNHVMVVGLRKTSSISEYFSDIMCPNDTTKLSYFLKHAHDPQDGFSLKGFRLSDFLLADYFRQDCPRALLEILRYGCSDLLKKKCLEMKRHNWRRVGTMYISEYKLLDTLQFFLSLVSYMGPTTKPELQAKADCLKIIFRSLYMFSFEQLYALSDFADYTDGLKEFQNFGMKFLNEANRFPELDERMGKTAPSLKHMCRFEIRKILYNNWALPSGIKSLGLVHSLEEYLDLKTD